MTKFRFDTLPAAFQHTASVDPDAVALRTPGGEQLLTWREYAYQVRAFAGGLSAIGLSHGDTVAFMMSNRIEFYPLEVAAQHLGATSFSVYNTLPSEQLAYVLANSGAQVAVCEAQYVRRIRESGVALNHVITLDGAADADLSPSDLITLGRSDFDFDAAWRAVRADDIATLIYTSGTTGKPKGVEITHASLMFQVYGLADVLGISFADTTTSYLPTAHIADRVAGLYIQEVLGTQVTCVADMKQLSAALIDVRPTTWGAVPRVWEKLKAGIERLVVNEADIARRTTMEWALAVAAEHGRYRLAGQPVPSDLDSERERADLLVFRGLRAALGLDRLRWAISGAAPIPTETLEFFAGLGIPICEAWGMSELAAVCSVSPPGKGRTSTVGKLLPGMQARLAADGELLVRGPLVMKGYRSLPEHTRETLDDKGWLHTGDIATIDEDGYLSIVDRKKDIIINAAGKNMSPAHIENTIKAAAPLIGSIAVIGDARPYNTALLVLDVDTAESYARQHVLSDASAAFLTTHVGVINAVKTGIALANQRLSRVEQIKRFRLLPAFWEVGAEETTPTMKLKRKVIAAKYAELIDAMYRQDLDADVHEPHRLNG